MFSPIDLMSPTAYGIEVDAIIERARSLNAADAERLLEAHQGGPLASDFTDEHDAALAGAADVASRRAAGCGLEESLDQACSQAWETAHTALHQGYLLGGEHDERWDHVLDAVCQAVMALVVREHIAPSLFETLYGSWSAAMGSRSGARLN